MDEWMIKSRSLASKGCSVLTLAEKHELLFMLWNCPSSDV